MENVLKKFLYHFLFHELNDKVLFLFFNPKFFYLAKWVQILRTNALKMKFSSFSWMQFFSDCYKQISGRYFKYIVFGNRQTWR